MHVLLYSAHSVPKCFDVCEDEDCVRCTRKNRIFSTKENERMGEQKRPKKCVAFNYFSQFYLVIFVLFSFEIKRCLKIVVYYTQFNCFFAHRSSRLPQFFVFSLFSPFSLVLFAPFSSLFMNRYDSMCVLIGTN